jgi:O-methyltransferase domain
MPPPTIATRTGYGDRVLHDWDDQQCRALLQRCAEVMPERAELLIVERLLPEDESPSLAVAWDIHMMCNVGGRERTVSQYRELLAESGFELIGQDPLPLDAALLRARPAGSWAGL